MLDIKGIPLAQVSMLIEALLAELPPVPEVHPLVQALSS